MGWIKDVSWWNGLRGQEQRRIWLYTDGTLWRVEARQGPSGNNGERPIWRSPTGTEAEAHALAAAMRARNPGDDWREMPQAWIE
ncbi:hypothetical protein ACFQZ4_24225 [Catellatospora coxensis]|uniref:hypothetical protein n=1 Tax=Catellatospora coxensis TaxID=310354 RepID=UPI0019437F06|nr:hypothetical protein [Catellatospora coxensis]